MADSASKDDTITAKAVTMCVLFTFSMVLGTLPIKLAQWLGWKSGTKNHIYVQHLLSLGGGVLMCTTFLHLLPEVEENCEKIQQFQNFKLPLGPTLMCAGFFTMFLVEELVHFYIHKRTYQAFRSARGSIAVSRGNLVSGESEENLQQIDIDHQHIPHSHEDHSHIIIENSTIITIRGLLIVLALCIHELFEGLAVGLEASAGNVWYMFGAVAAHKLVIAFCIGVELVTSNMRSLLVVVYVFTFAVVSPLGIGIGIAVTEEQESTTILSVILQGLASGTLLYVVFFEILRDDRKKGLGSYFAILLGFTIMLAVKLMENE